MRRGEDEYHGVHSGSNEASREADANSIRLEDLLE